jgi:hypothetical protein
MRFIRTIIATLLLTGICFAAEKVNVKVVNRRTSETGYNYTVPGHSTSTSNANVNCYGSTSVSCSGTSRTSGYTTAPRDVSYSVTGATFSLLLPDGRVAVVNCVSKFAERMAGPAGNHRSCRVPLVNDIQVEFKGSKAKLFWPVSVDGKKLESETYKILSVLDK